MKEGIKFEAESSTENMTLADNMKDVSMIEGVNNLRGGGFPLFCQ